MKILPDNGLRKRLAGGQLTVGSWITLGHPAIAEIMAGSGFDWLTVDMEHSAITLDQAQQLIQVISLCGIVPLVRVGDNNPYLIKRVMDAGAYGVIVPMVNTREDAINAVHAVRYPPLGKRGVGLARAQGYGFDFERYREWCAGESVVVVQIEHIEAINNLEEILAVEGVDGSMIGPYDLSGSLGIPGDFEAPAVKEAMIRYEEICRNMGKNMGFHIVQPDPDMAKRYLARGYTFLAVGLDTLFLGQHARRVVEALGACRT
ncbi:MAG: aldolase/citrate lyase family protein [Pseudomonadota bacterium]